MVISSIAGSNPKCGQAGTSAVSPIREIPAAIPRLVSVPKRLLRFFAMPGTNQPSTPIAAPMKPKLHSGSSMSR